MTRNRYSKIFESLMYEIAKDKTLTELFEIATKEFKYHITKKGLQQYLSKRQIRYKDYNPRLARTSGHPQGYEYTKEDGMTIVKIGNEWKYKQRLIYEQAHNVKLTEKDFIMFIDGDRSNFNIDNLIKVDREVASYIANMHLVATNKDIIDSAIALARAEINLRNVQGIKPVSHKRKEVQHETSRA